MQTRHVGDHHADFVSYCNSILQCLYHSVSFREHVLNFPSRSSPDSVEAASANAVARSSALRSANGAAASKTAPTTSARNPGSNVSGSQKPDDKDSPEYKKRQALLNGPILNMSYQNTSAYFMPETLFTALKDVFEAVVLNQSRTGVVSPTKFLEVLRRDNEMFRSMMHQDAHEFLNWVLNKSVENVEAHAAMLGKSMHPGVDDPWQTRHSFSHKAEIFSNAGPATTRWINDLFEGTLTSETRCLTCENISQRDEAFLDLSVDLDQHSSVTACLRRFSEEEMLCERNKFHCDKCGGLQEAEKRMKIKRLPKILALHLKRFKYTEDLQRLQKLFHRVVYPYHLRLFNTTDDAENPDKLYELYAVVVHIGSGPYHGHYVAIIKTKDWGWLLFDDEMVEPVGPEYVRNFFGDRSGLACAYVLFYQESSYEYPQEEEAVHAKQPASGDAQAAKLPGKRDNGPSANPCSLPDEVAGWTTPFHFDQTASSPPLPPLKAAATAPSSLVAPSTSPKRPDFRWRKEWWRDEKSSAERDKDRSDRHKKHVYQQSSAQPATSIEHGSSGFHHESSAAEQYAAPEGAGKENSPVLGGLKRTSKSLKFGTLGRKDKPSSSEDQPEPPQSPERDKRNRFGIRKKSFGILS